MLYQSDSAQMMLTHMKKTPHTVVSHYYLSAMPPLPKKNFKRCKMTMIFFVLFLLHFEHSQQCELKANQYSRPATHILL